MDANPMHVALGTGVLMGDSDFGHETFPRNPRFAFIGVHSRFPSVTDLQVIKGNYGSIGARFAVTPIDRADGNETGGDSCPDF